MQGNLNDEVQVLVDQLAARVQQSVAIDNPQGDIIAISRHYGDEDGYRLKLVLERTILAEYRGFFGPYVRALVEGTSSIPVLVPACPELLVVGRIGYPIRDGSQVLAILWFIDRGVELPQEVVLDYCARLAPLLSKRQSRGPLVDAGDTAEVIERFLSGRQVDQDGTALWLADAKTEFYVLAALPSSAADGVQAAFRTIPQTFGVERISLACITSMDGVEVAVFGTSFQDDAAPGETMRRLLAATTTCLANHAALPGLSISGPGGVTALRELYVEASLSAFLARHLHTGTHAADAQSSSGLISALCTPVEALETPPMEVLKKMLVDADGFAFDTLGALVHSNGTQTQIIESLRIHRTTLHYRIRQIEERSGLNFQVPADMFMATLLWLRVALKRSEISPLAIERAQHRPLGFKPAVTQTIK